MPVTYVLHCPKKSAGSPADFLIPPSYITRPEHSPQTECEAAPFTAKHLPARKRTSRKSPPPVKASQISALHRRGLAGSSRREREVWRGRETSFKRSPSPSKVFFPLQGLSLFLRKRHSQTVATLVVGMPRVTLYPDVGHPMPRDQKKKPLP